MQISKFIKHSLAIVIASAGLWLLPYLGFHVIDFMIGHFNRWWWSGLGNPYTTWQKIAIAYLGWTGSQLPAVAFAGLIIGLARFRHPLRVCFWTVIIFHLFFIAVNLSDLGWFDIQGSEQFTLMLAHSVSVFVLVGAGILVAWFSARRFSPPNTELVCKT